MVKFMLRANGIKSCQPLGQDRTGLVLLLQRDLCRAGNRCQNAGDGKASFLHRLFRVRPLKDDGVNDDAGMCRPVFPRCVHNEKPL